MRGGKGTGRRKTAYGLATPALLALLLAGSAVAAIGIPGTIVVDAGGGTEPSPLPRGEAVPIALDVRFESIEPHEGSAPSLNRIAIELSRRVSVDTTGLPSCPLHELYATAAVVAEECGRSRLGSGSVRQEIPIGGAAIPVEGTLTAYLGSDRGAPMVLARVETAEPAPLVYVIPFAIERSSTTGRTSLVAHQMRTLRGVCPAGQPNCFADPYGVKDIYSRISRLQLHLKRAFRHAGTARSLLSASCPASRRHPRGRFALAEVALRYSNGARIERQITGACR